MRLLPISLLVLSTSLSAIVSANVSAQVQLENSSIAWSYMLPLTDAKLGIGARPAGSKAEQKATKWLVKQWQQQGYQPQVLPFSYDMDGAKYHSQNIQIDIKGKNEKLIVIGAHYDSTGEDHGSLGAADNASGVAAILALSAKLKGKSLPYSIRLLALGAEEVSLQGAKAYINQQISDLDKVIGMINLDTIIGGDKLYVHSAHTTPYDCSYLTSTKYNADTKLRDALKGVSKQLFNTYAHQLHPAYDGYPEGVTGSWSDHAPFACSGVPVAYLEATNFAINGHSGNDGYSQTEKEQLWDCYNSDKKTACDRKKEQSWGMIWHTKFDRVDALEPVMPGRLQKQLEQNVLVLEHFTLNADNYL